MARPAGPSATVRDWESIVSRVNDHIAKARYGTKDKVLGDLSAELGISPFLLRRAVAARTSIERLVASGVSIPASLRTSVVGVTDVVVRWAERDPAAAFAAFDDYSAGRITFRAMLGAEVAARPPGGAVRQARTIDVIRAFKMACLERLQNRLKPEQRLVSITRGERLPVDAWIEFLSAENPRSAVLVVGPYRDGKRYEADVPATALRAAGLALIGHPATLVIPYASAAKAYRSWLAEFRVPDRDVTVIAIRAPTPIESSE